MELGEIARADLILVTVSGNKAHVRVRHVVLVLHDGTLGEWELGKDIASDEEQD